MSVWFKSRLNPWYIWIPSNPNLYSTKIIMKMRWQTIASNVSIRTISPTATPLPKAYDCVAGRRTSLVVYGWWPQPPTKNLIMESNTNHDTPWPPLLHNLGQFFFSRLSHAKGRGRTGSVILPLFDAIVMLSPQVTYTDLYPCTHNCCIWFIFYCC